MRIPIKYLINQVTDGQILTTGNQIPIKYHANLVAKTEIPTLDHQNRKKTPREFDHKCSYSDHRSYQIMNQILRNCQINKRK